MRPIVDKAVFIQLHHSTLQPHVLIEPRKKRMSNFSPLVCSPATSRHPSQDLQLKNEIAEPGARYCPSNHGPCGNHMTLYINLKQQEDKGVIYTRGRDGEHRHNKGVRKQDTGTLLEKDDPAPPSMPDVNKANGIMGYMGQTT